MPIVYGYFLTGGVEELAPYDAAPVEGEADQNIVRFPKMLNADGGLNESLKQVTSCYQSLRK
jgi:hypothetical protein